MKWKSQKWWLKGLSLLLLFFFLMELFLRFIIGLGDVPVYREDKEYEYFYAPNQNVWRYGNNIITNELGMRSGTLDSKKKITILEFGDSVLNGGSHVDQNDLTTTVQEKDLNRAFNNEIQVLNISAQSWGPSNAFAFLKKHGDFNAKIIVLVFSSHDLNDNMHFRKVVGQHDAWPDSKPWFATTDLLFRYLWPKTKAFFTGESEYDYLIGFDDSKVNPGWQDFIAYCKLKNIELIIYLHASIEEVKNGEYDHRGKKIMEIAKSENIMLIKDNIELRGKDDVFKDNIHLNGKGHAIITNLLVPELKKKINNKFIKANS